MICQCFDALRAKADDQIKKGTHKGIVEGSYSSKWRGQTFAFRGNKCTTEVVLTVEASMTLVKKGGGAESRKTHKELVVPMNYCPFCGKAIER